MSSNSRPVALVTGGAAGIGAAVVEQLLSEGYAVGVLDIKAPTIPLSDHARFFLVDLSEAGQIEETVRKTQSELGRLDVLVNNAGLTLPRSIDETSVVEWDRLQAVNLRAVFLTTKYALPMLRDAQHPAIVNIASFHAVATIENFSAYASSKSGVIGLTRSSALELAPFGIRVNAVCPGVVHTAMVDAWLETQDDQDAALGSMVEKQPLARLGQPREIAAAISFLASPAASYITGTSLVVDGGVSARLWHA